MGEKQGNCIYIDTEGMWWLAETDQVMGESDIIIIEDKTEIAKEVFTEEFVKFVNSITPHLLFKEEGDESWKGTDAKERKVVF